MERGAGASNLHIRFNLAAVKPGEVTLSKKITGSDDVDYDLMEFPYRILYRTQEDIDAGGESWTALVQDENDPTVTYQGPKRPVKFLDRYTPVGETTPCENVFFLKPGEIASIKMPVDAVDYKIVECGVNMNIFESVKANEELLSDSTDTGRNDYETSADTVKDRPEVAFENEVDPDSLRTLTITKNLQDEEGNVLTGYEPDSTTFNFRVSMSAQDSAVLTPVRNKEYFVRDNENNYCRWDVETQRFVSLGISSYQDLADLLDSMTASEKTSIVFETSNNGAVSRIPGGYRVEFRGLPVDSSFQVIEREDEIPAGYTLVEYEVAGVPVKILKVDQSRNPLAGAEFSLSGNGISEDGLVSALREVEVPGDEGQTVTEALIYENPALPIGEYTLTETGTPSGYIDLEGDVTISVESTSTGIVVTAKIGETEIEYPKVAKDPSTGEWTVEITNQSGAVLPYTGGPGTEFIRLLGVFLTVLAGAGLVIVKRRRDTLN